MESYIFCYSFSCFIIFFLIPSFIFHDCLFYSKLVMQQKCFQQRCLWRKYKSPNIDIWGVLHQVSSLTLTSAETPSLRKLQSHKFWVFELHLFSTESGLSISPSINYMVTLWTCCSIRLVFTSSLDTISIDLVFFPLIWICVWHSWNALWGLTVSHLSPRYSTLAQGECEMPLPAPVTPHVLAWPPLCLLCPEPGQLWQPGHRFLLLLPNLDAVQTHGVWNLASPRMKYKRVSL